MEGDVYPSFFGEHESAVFSGGRHPFHRHRRRHHRSSVSLEFVEEFGHSSPGALTDIAALGLELEPVKKLKTN